MKIMTIPLQRNTKNKDKCKTKQWDGVSFDSFFRGTFNGARLVTPRNAGLFLFFGWFQGCRLAGPMNTGGQNNF